METKQLSVLFKLSSPKPLGHVTLQKNRNSVRDGSCFWPRFVYMNSSEDSESQVYCNFLFIFVDRSSQWNGWNLLLLLFSVLKSRRKIDSRYIRRASTNYNWISLLCNEKKKGKKNFQNSESVTNNTNMIVVEVTEIADRQPYYFQLLNARKCVHLVKYLFRSWRVAMTNTSVQSKE